MAVALKDKLLQWAQTNPKLIRSAALNGMVVALTLLLWWICAFFVGGVLAFAAGVLLTLLAVRKIALAMLFPGSTFLLRRAIEYEESKHVKAQLRAECAQLREVLSVAAQKGAAQLRGGSAPFVVLQTYAKLYEDEAFAGGSKYRREAAAHLAQAGTALRHVRAQRVEDGERFACTLVDVRSTAAVVELQARLAAFEAALELRGFRHFWGDDSFGCFDQRRRLLTPADAESFRLRCSDGASLDCVLFAPSSKVKKAVFVLCNANAELLEFRLPTTEYIRALLSEGLHVCLWNYRGYGGSSSAPRLQRVLDDGVELVDELSKSFAKVALYGRSLGGAVAASVARRRKVALLVTDRSLDSLWNVVRSEFSAVEATLFTLLNAFHRDFAADFVAAECEKAIVFTRTDAIIPFRASMVLGAVGHLLRQKLRSAEARQTALRTLEEGASPESVLKAVKGSIGTIIEEKQGHNDPLSPGAWTQIVALAKCAMLS